MAKVLTCPWSPCNGKVRDRGSGLAQVSICSLKGDEQIVTKACNSPFALSTLHILHFKLPVKISPQPQPLEESFLHA